MKKECSKCHKEQDREQFFKNKGCKDGLGSWCKSCQDVYNKAYYPKNKDKYRARESKRRKEFRTRIIALKTDRPCADCKNSYPPVCMDFDHIAGEKLFDIASFPSTMKWERIQAEIDKCELVCANCHRLRTEKRAL